MSESQTIPPPPRNEGAGRGLLYSGIAPAHVCSPPRKAGDAIRMEHKGRPWMVETDHLDTAIWRCRCGQHWEAFGGWWDRVSARKARKRLKLAGLSSELQSFRELVSGTCTAGKVIPE